MSITKGMSTPTISYVALGDSYTIGTGASPQESWPALIANRMKQKGVSFELVANLGQNGWTAKDLIEYQLPVFNKIHPDYVSLLIGTNDWVQGVDAHIFEEHYIFILENILKVVSNPQHVIIVTIPDFSITPAGNNYSGGRDIARGLDQFNEIIKKHAKAKGFKVIDLYPLSQTMGQDVSLFAADGLHPSAKGYARWADLIESGFMNE